MSFIIPLQKDGAEMDSNKLKDYLKAVSDLETSIFRQQEIINAAQSSLKMTTPERAKLIEPSLDLDKDYPMPSGPYIPSMEVWREIGGKSAEQARLNRLGIIILLISISILFILLKTGSRFWAITLLGFTCSAILFVEGSKAAKDCRDREYLKAENDMRDATIQLREQAKAKYDSDYQSYLDAVKEDEASYQIAYRNAEINYQNAKDAISTLNGPLEESRKALNSLYDLNIIFEKYRNIVAMTTIYEYFASGRCSELEGPNGAYNLYESELRQNLIVTKLDAIIDSLDEIKNNQFVLYKELSKMNTQISEVKALTEQVVRNTERTADLSALNAELAAITAGNTSFIAAAVAFM